MNKESISKTLLNQLVTAVESTLHNLPDITIHNLLSDSPTSYILQVDGRYYWELLENDGHTEEFIESLQSKSDNIHGNFYELHEDGSITGYNSLDEWANYDIKEYANHLAERLVAELDNFPDRLKSYCLDSEQLELDDEVIEQWLDELS